VLLCGRYEGVDERVAEHLATEETSIGDFVLSGGELGAALVLDAVTRLLPGALGNEASRVQESFSAEADRTETGGAAGDGISRRAGPIDEPEGSGILDYAHYTRPQEFRGWAVPEMLISGHHEQIRRWRRKQALTKTLRNRPDLIERARLSEEDRLVIAEFAREPMVPDE